MVSPVSVDYVISIMRDVTGRNDPDDPRFTDTVMLNYLNDFVQSDKPQNVRLFEDQTWWEFTLSDTDDDPYPVDLDSLGFSTIQPPAYADGFEIYWYQNPREFFRIWPETQEFNAQRPTYVLWYNDELVFRGPPDTDYDIKIAANSVRLAYNLGDNIDRAYIDRYLAYGASLLILGDFAETQRFGEVQQMFKQHRANVLARTWQQNNNQRATPEF